jgi:hypothetical protein
VVCYIITLNYLTVKDRLEPCLVLISDGLVAHHVYANSGWVSVTKQAMKNAVWHPANSKTKVRFLACDAALYALRDSPEKAIGFALEHFVEDQERHKCQHGQNENVDVNHVPLQFRLKKNPPKRVEWLDLIRCRRNRPGAMWTRYQHSGAAPRPRVARRE